MEFLNPLTPSNSFSADFLNADNNLVEKMEPQCAVLELSWSSSAWIWVWSEPHWGDHIHSGLKGGVVSLVGPQQIRAQGRPLCRNDVSSPWLGRHM